jgi:hypothetical protein
MQHQSYNHTINLDTGDIQMKFTGKMSMQSISRTKQVQRQHNENSSPICVIYTIAHQIRVLNHEETVKKYSLINS